MQAQTEAETRALWLFNLCYGTTWQNEDQIDQFEIAVFSSEEEFNALNELAETRTIHEKPVKVYRYKKYKDIKQHEIVYVTKSENAYLGFVYEKFRDKKVLIVSDRSKQAEYSVINFRDVSDTKKYDLNTLLGSKQHFKFTDQIIKLGGNREDLMYLYSVTNKKLRESEEELIKIKTESDKKDKKIKQLENDIIELKKRIQELEK